MMKWRVSILDVHGCECVAATSLVRELAARAAWYQFHKHNPGATGKMVERLVEAGPKRRRT